MIQMMMKKYLLMMTVLLTLGGASVKAQTFGFQYQGQSLDDDATVTIAAEKNAFGELSCETNPSANPKNGLMLRIPEGTTANVKATLQITHNTLSPITLQWCMGGECVPVNDQNVFSKQFSTNEDAQVQFDAINLQSEGYLQATLKATIGLETHQVNIQFTNGETAGIRKQLSKHQQAPAIYDLNGHRMEGALPAGLYIVKDGLHQSKKIIK